MRSWSDDLCSCQGIKRVVLDIREKEEDMNGSVTSVHICM